MDTADSQHLSRISKTLLAAVGVSFAWILLSIALGFSASHAHADEDPGLLGSVTGIVEDTASGATVLAQDATAPVGETAVQAVETASPIVETVAPVVETVAHVVPADPVVEVVETAVTPALTTVTHVADEGVVAPVVETAVGVVGAVPVVGGVVSALGVDTAAYMRPHRRAVRQSPRGPHPTLERGAPPCNSGCG